MCVTLLLYKQYCSSVCVNKIYFLYYDHVFQSFVLNSLDTL